MTAFGSGILTLVRELSRLGFLSSLEELSLDDVRFICLSEGIFNDDCSTIAN